MCVYVGVEWYREKRQADCKISVEMQKGKNSQNHLEEEEDDDDDDDEVVVGGGGGAAAEVIITDTWRAYAARYHTLLQ